MDKIGDLIEAHQNRIYPEWRFKQDQNEYNKKPVSIWDDTSTETIRTRNDGVYGAVDVAIVGAGFTGLSAAIHCARNGYGMSCD